MSLQSQLSSFYDEFHSGLPAETSATLKSVTQNLKNTYDPSTSIQAGGRFPDFRLKDPTGRDVTKDELLKHGPLLVSFYRGGWCPFCNIQLRALQELLHEFKAKGVTLVAISPELPDYSLTAKEKNNLEFPVLSDVGNLLGAQIDLEARNGDASLEVPIPATILIDRNGIVRNVHVDANYHERLEPATTLSWIDALPKPRLA